MTVDEFERLSDERIELSNGHVFGKGELTPARVLTLGLLRLAIEPSLPVGRFIRKDEPVRIPDYNEPFADLAVVRGNLQTYANRHPGPEDVSLIIEVSDTTLVKDRGDKQENYARAAVPVYWIVNLVHRQIEVYSAPSSNGYASRLDFKPGQSVPFLIDRDHVGLVKVDDVLPRGTR